MIDCYILHNSLNLCYFPAPCSQEKALLDEIKELAKKKEALQIRLEQAQNRMDLAM